MGFASLVAFFSIVIAQKSAAIVPLDDSSHGCPLNGVILPNGSYTPADRCIQYKCNGDVWEYNHMNPTCGKCQSSSKKTQNTSIKMYDPHSIGGRIIQSYPFDRSAGNYIFSQDGLSKTPQFGIKVKFIYTEENESRITKLIYTESKTKVELETTGHNGDAKILVNGTVIKPTPNVMTPYHSDVGTVYISHDITVWPALSGGNIHIVGSQGLAVSIWTNDGFAWFVKSSAMPFLKNKLNGLCDVYTNTTGRVTDPVTYTKQDGKPTASIMEFIESWEVDTNTNDRSAD